MQVLRLLHKWSVEQVSGVHMGRRAALWVGVEALLRGRQLWLTALGRHVRGAANERHRIKRMDRLLGNRHMNAEREQWYGWLCRQMVGATVRPVIVVDWSDLDERKELYVLRAALAVGGRALPIYEEVHQRYGDAALHRRFLKRLSRLLGAHCRPIVVTDAGFRVWWFELVAQQGWHYVGRVRNRELVCRVNTHTWQSNTRLRRGASTRARSLGTWLLSKKRALATSFYLYKGKAKGRVDITRHGQRARSGHSRKAAKRAHEPWLLVSNLPEHSGVAKQVVALYRQRMQIEEGFRDLKAPRHGFALRQNTGRDPERVANLLLLAALAMYALWLLGLHGERFGLHRALQANTVRTRRTLSVFFVGSRLLANAVRIRAPDLSHARQLLHAHVQQQVPA